MLNWLRQNFGKPRVYFTSDLHFSHRNVIDYCKRPFKNVQEMNEHIVKVWNNTVRKKDKVYILGDFSLNPKVAQVFAKRLNGYLVLISGNHDSPFIGNKNSRKMVDKYLESFNEVYANTAFTSIKGIPVQLCHLPFAPKEGENLDTRYLQYRPEDRGQILLCGHLHGRFKKHNRMIDVGYDAHNGVILSEQAVYDLIIDSRDHIDSHLTANYNNRNSDIS